MQQPVVVRDEVHETKFGLFSEDEIRAISVCRVTSSVAYDALGNTLQGGLYDARMGPRFQSEMCVTCGLNGKDCPGHVGHIELEVPVYHPLLFMHMFQLLRASCAFCHGMRMSKERCRAYLLKLQLYEMNEVEAAQDLFDQMVPPTAFADDEDNTSAAEIEEKLKSYEAKYAHFCRVMAHRAKDRSAKPILSESAKKGQHETILQFQKEAALVKKCENCGALSPAYRKDGYNKIFRKAPSMRMKQQMASSKRKMTSALEVGADQDAATDDDKDGDEDDEDENDDKMQVGDEEDAVARPIKYRKLAKEEKEPDKVVAPNEVQAAIKALWSSNTQLLHFIWGRPFRNLNYSPSAAEDANAATGYKVFFAQCLLVPANRFRPEAHIGERATESPQNTYLSKIIVLSDEIARLVRETKIAQGALKKKKDASESDSDSDTSNNSTKSSDDGEEEEGKAKAGSVSNLSRIMGAWIQLQDAVNCYMDSAKDPNPLANNKAAAGIRQVLERKEGMFRMNMMGKRVNFCCRSVISPDPYIGTNEIGIPKHMAMALHYPEPVNGFNVKHLRTLVERGPDEYPGAFSFIFPPPFFFAFLTPKCAR